MGFRGVSTPRWTPSGTKDDFQTVPRRVAVLRTEIPPGSSTCWHAHPRFQLLYATHGLMTVALEESTWFVPEGHGLLIPRDAMHRASCIGPLGLCTAYIDAQCFGDRPPGLCRLLEVSPLLDISLQSLAEEAILYDDDGRGGALATLIVEEVLQAPDTLFPLPMPADKRLKKLCQSLIETPSLGLDIDSWAVTIGVSRRTLTRRFRSETGLSFAEWRRRLRAFRALTQQAHGTPDHVAARSNGYASATALRAMIRRMGREATRKSERSPIGR